MNASCFFMLKICIFLNKNTEIIFRYRTKIKVEVYVFLDIILSVDDLICYTR